MKYSMLLSVVGLLLAAGGCADPKEAELVTAQKSMQALVSQCIDDVKRVPAEHSMNCIEATRLVHPNYHFEDNKLTLLQHCYESESDACDEYEASLVHSQMRYWSAIARSIARFGTPWEVDKGTSNPAGVYNFAHFMEPYFAACLEKHPDPPPPEPIKKQELRAGETPVPEDPGSPEENKNCIGLGTNQLGTYP